MTNTATCDHEIYNGNSDDPEYAWCGLSAGHGGNHHYEVR